MKVADIPEAISKLRANILFDEEAEADLTICTKLQQVHFSITLSLLEQAKLEAELAIML